MTFGAPTGLLLVALVPLVILWHLRRLRRRRAVVASLDPWRRLVGVSRHRRRLPPLVLLLLHVAAALALGLAAGDPRWPRAGVGSGDVALVLDVGVGMGEAGRWDAAMAAVARQIRTSGRVTVVLAGREPRALVARGHPAAVRRAAREQRPGEAGSDLTGAAHLSRQLAGPAARLVVVTDEPDPQNVDVTWIDVSGGRPASNRAVTAAGASGGRLFARIANYADERRDLPLRVEVDGQLLDERVIGLGPGESADAAWPLPTEAAAASVAVAGEDDLPLDDAAIVAIDHRPRLGQLVGQSAALQRALAALENWRIRYTGRATFAVDGSVELSVFVGAFPERLPPGGVLIVAPQGPEGGADVAWLGPEGGADVAPQSPEGGADAAPRELSGVGGHPLVAGLDLAGVRVVSGPALGAPSWSVPVLTAGGQTVAYAGTTGESRVVVLALDPDDPAGNFAQRPAFPLFVARSVDWIAGQPSPGAVAVGAAVNLPPGVFAVEGPEGTSVAAAGRFTVLGPGLYTARRGGTAPLELRFGGRSGDDDASDLRMPRAAAFVAPGPPPTDGVPQEAASGEPIGPLLGAAALAVILVEGAWRTRPAKPGDDSRRRA